jgi:hypothetical protein
MVLAILAALALQAKSDAPTPARWMTDLKDAQAQARALGRPLVIDAGREA